MSLQARLLQLFGRGVHAPLPQADFSRLALEVFAHQFARNVPYAAYCRVRGKTPDTVTAWEDIPAVPTAAFKVADLTTIPPQEVRVIYHTSGTTHGKPGRHLLPDTRLYDAALLPNFKAHVLPDVDRMRILICGPNAEHFPHSSLGHMNSAALKHFGAEGSGLFWTDAGPQFDSLALALEQADSENVPVCLLGTAFGFVHFLDSLRRSFRLPEGSRIMDTGGYKGRSREVPSPELYRMYTERLGIPPARIVNEYGMTELGSQFYGTPRKVSPPWVRVTVVDPETLRPLPQGEPGLLRFFDLANVHTVAAIQTDDLGVMREGGFELLGRAPGAEPRGCSLAVEDLLAARAGE